MARARRRAPVEPSRWDAARSVPTHGGVPMIRPRRARGEHAPVFLAARLPLRVWAALSLGLVLVGLSMAWRPAPAAAGSTVWMCDGTSLILNTNGAQNSFGT